MNRSHLSAAMLLSILLLPLSASWTTAAETISPSTAPEAAAQFFDALASVDVDRAVAMTAPLKGVPNEAVRAYYERASEFAKKAGRPQIVSHLQLNTLAVVIFLEYGPGKIAAVDLDPAYLLRHNGKWLVIFKLTEFNRPELELDEATLANFRKLEGWYESQIPQLRKILAGD